MNKKALKEAALLAVIVLAAVEAIAFLVQAIDPQGGLLRIDLQNPVIHVVILVAALAAGIFRYIGGSAKKSDE